MGKLNSIINEATYPNIDYKKEIKNLTKYMLENKENIVPLPKIIFKHKSIFLNILLSDTRFGWQIDIRLELGLGFGTGLELDRGKSLVAFRDVIPFPRTPKNCEF